MESTAKDKDTPALDKHLAYALGHPLRARIVIQLRRRPMELGGLAEELGEPLALVTYHHGVLEAAGGLPGNEDRN